MKKEIFVPTEHKPISDLENIPWGPLGLITFTRTYARRLNPEDPASQVETFNLAIDRVLNACRDQLNCEFTIEEEYRLKEHFLNLRCSVAGRFLWQLGTSTVDKFGLFSLQNCAFTNVNSIKAFVWSMDALMLGSGVGFNIQKANIAQLPLFKQAKIERLDTKDADYIVPDSREGWVRLLKKALKAHVKGRGFSYSTVCIRGKGTPIKGFGGLASGPEELAWGIGEISNLINRRVESSRLDRVKLTSVDCLDIMNIIGFIVVSGNVRRSAQIAIGDHDDTEYLRSKRWDLGNIPNWRAMSNNSVVCDDFSKLSEEFWEGYNGNGEPFGLINLSNARAYGRAGDLRYPDPRVGGFNPCAEQSLEPYETCCLSEIYLPNAKTKAQLQDIAILLYRINKHSLRLPCHQAETEAIVHKNMRMGIGITGYLQATEEQKSWLPSVYESLRHYDKTYSQQKEWPESIKLTTVKPSGTLSLLPGVTPGCHPAYAKFYIRRIRIASNSNLIKVCKDHGYGVEPQLNFDGTEDRNTMVVSFPCRVPEGTIVAKEMTAVKQLEVVKRLQTDWSDNAVSCTIYYKQQDLAQIKRWLSENYGPSIKTVSFLLHSEHGFKQAPYEEITEETYTLMAANTKPILSIDNALESEIDLGDDCAGGACPIK